MGWYKMANFIGQGNIVASNNKYYIIDIMKYNIIYVVDRELLDSNNLIEDKNIKPIMVDDKKNIYKLIKKIDEKYGEHGEWKVFEDVSIEKETDKIRDEFKHKINLPRIASVYKKSCRSSSMQFQCAYCRKLEDKDTCDPNDKNSKGILLSRKDWETKHGSLEFLIKNKDTGEYVKIHGDSPVNKEYIPIDESGLFIDKKLYTTYLVRYGKNGDILVTHGICLPCKEKAWNEYKGIVK
ncbi:MAG: hypothetical protein AABY32_02190 [Nanoarchaeota archaeon]